MSALEDAINEMISPRINEISKIVKDNEEETDDRFERLLEILIQLNQKPNIVPSPS